MPVTVALIAEAVVTSDEMRRFLDRTGLTGTQADEETDWLHDLINAYSLAAARYCNRQFTPERASVGGAWPLQSGALVTAEPKEFQYKGAGYLSFSPYEPRAVSSIVVGSDLLAADQWTLSPGTASAEAEYRLEPAEKTSLGTWLYVLLPPVDLTRSRWNRLIGRRVRVTGDWGPTVTPEDVKHAVKIAVAQGFRNPEGYAGRDSGGMEIVEQADRFVGSLPGESRALLKPYRRPM